MAHRSLRVPSTLPYNSVIGTPFTEGGAAARREVRVQSTGSGQEECVQSACFLGDTLFIRGQVHSRLYGTSYTVRFTVVGLPLYARHLVLGLAR